MVTKCGELPQGPHRPLNRSPIIRTNGRFCHSLEFLHPRRPGCMPTPALIGQVGEDDPTVSWIQDSLDQPFRLQPIDHLGDVRPDTIHPCRQFAQWNRSARINQVTEYAELRDRELDLSHRLLNPVLKPSRQLQEGEQLGLTA